ncbi:MAG: phage tail tube protein [Solirubrobacterales bacterium]|nr:phage tail tube protein [Solirubrobacterales bacterium]
MAGIDAFGTVLKIDDGTGTNTYDEVAEIVSLNPLDISADDIDVSSHNSPQGWKEFVGGLKDGGTVSCEINFDPALHGDLIDLIGVTRAMLVVFPADADDAEVWFDGYINGLTGEAPHDDKLSGTLSLKVSGPVSITIPT